MEQVGWRRAGRQLLAAVAALALTGAGAPRTPEGEVDQARRLAREDFASSLFLCEANSTKIADMLAGGPQWFAPARAFDNLWYIGSNFVGAWVLDTGEGLIVFDALQSEAEVRQYLEPGLRSLGFAPTDIRYLIVTHGHWDHYGGAKYLQDKYGTRIALSAADWDTMERSPPGSIIRAPYFGADRADRVPPRRDMVIADGQKLRLGHSEITLLVTPGHSHGTLSALVPVREGGRRYVLSLLGGTAFPRTMEPDVNTGGLLAFERSVRRLSEVSRRAGAVGLINTHIFADGGDKRLAARQALKPGARNPFVLGTANVTRYYAMFQACLRAAQLRPQDANAAPPMPSVKP